MPLVALPIIKDQTTTTNYFRNFQRTGHSSHGFASSSFMNLRQQAANSQQLLPAIPMAPLPKLEAARKNQKVNMRNAKTKPAPSPAADSP